MKKTTNTRKKEVDMGWILGGNPGAIEAQEARGQQELVSSQQLPRRCNSPHGINATEQYAKMGIKVITPSKGDDLFMGVTLPNGWKKEATDHSMWNKLVDDKGRTRATFFYKAAFYDRDSFINFSTRYETGCDFTDKENYTYFAKDSSTNEIIFRTDKLSRDMNQPDYFKKQDELQAQCKDYLNNNFPDWQNINAYWD